METGLVEGSSKKSPTSVILLSVFLLILVTSLDHFTGKEISFSVFYLLPIVMVSWHVGRVPGVVFCILAAGLWWFIDINSNNTYSSSFIPFWNTVVRLCFFIIISSLLVELKSRLETEKLIAKTDGLTGLLNARAFKDHSKHSLELALRYEHPISLGYIDIDNFKWVNDQMGHSEGDQVLKEVAQTLARSVRSSDLVSRLGGDEFAVLLPETNSEGTRVIFDRISEDLKKLATNKEWPISFSIGVAIFPEVSNDIDNAIKHADNLMYHVKKAGKNHTIYEVFSQNQSRQFQEL